MLEHRFDAHAMIVPGEYAGTVGGGSAGLLRVVLTDHGPVADAFTGAETTRPDVFCHLTAQQARQLAHQLSALADQLITAPPAASTTL